MSPKRKKKKRETHKIFFVIPFVVEFCDLEEEMLWRQKEKTVATPTPLEKSVHFHFALALKPATSYARP